MKLSPINWFLLALIAFLGWCLIQDHRTNDALRSAVTPIKARIPQFKDPTGERLQAVSIPTDVPDRYLWRVWLPDGTRWTHWFELGNAWFEGGKLRYSRAISILEPDEGAKIVAHWDQVRVNHDAELVTIGDAEALQLLTLSTDEELNIRNDFGHKEGLVSLLIGDQSHSRPLRKKAISKESK